MHRYGRGTYRAVQGRGRGRGAPRRSADLRGGRADTPRVQIGARGPSQMWLACWRNVHVPLDVCPSRRTLLFRRAGAPRRCGGVRRRGALMGYRSPRASYATHRAMLYRRPSRSRAYGMTREALQTRYAPVSGRGDGVDLH